MKNRKKLNKIKEKIVVITTGITATLILGINKVYADSNTNSIDSFINFACDWLAKIRRSNCIGWRGNVRIGMAT